MTEDSKGGLRDERKKKKKRIKIWETKGREVLRELQSVTSIKAREK